MAAGAVEVNRTSINARKGAIFDGIDDFIEVTDSSLNITGNLTISAWFKRANLLITTNKAIVIRYFQSSAANAQWGIFISQTSNKLVFQTSDGSTESLLIYDFSGITDTKWHHVVGTWTPSSKIIYYDGVNVASVDPDEDFHQSQPTAKLGIGADIQSTKRYFFDGTINDVRIYKRALSQAEVTKLFNNENVAEELFAHWKLDKDYIDSAGSNDGTNDGTYLGKVEDTVAAAIAANRTTANDKYLIIPAAKQNQSIVNAVIEEAP